MNTRTISSLIGSSKYRAIADDSLKDEDNAAWVMVLEPHIQDEWFERIRWIRLVDRLAENELVESNSFEFHKFYNEWKKLLNTGQVEPDCTYKSILTNICDAWFKAPSSSVDRLSIQSWDRFLHATAQYHKPKLVIETLEQYREMLETLSGSCFQILPYLTEKYWEAAYSFGAVDQFFNNLRDMREDAAQGICYVPTELLEQFGVSRDEILQQTACNNPNYTKMMQFWLDDYLPTLYLKTHSLLMAEDLHPSWQIWRDWSFHRYRRIERIFRQCQFDYIHFPEVYWTEVKRDLPSLLAEVRRKQKCIAKIALNQDLHAREKIFPLMAKHSKKARKAVETFLNDFTFRRDRPTCEL